MGEKNTNSALELLLQKTGSGDRQAFRALYAATSSQLYAVLIRILRNEADAGDVLQEVYIAVWNRADRYDPDKGRAFAWLAIIARNAAIDAMRRRRPGHFSEEYCDLQESNEPSPFDHVQTLNVSDELSLRLQGLPERQRDAVLQFYIKEKSLAEIADAMDAPINTVKSWVRRGVLNLRTTLQGRSIRDFI